MENTMTNEELKAHLDTIPRDADGNLQAERVVDEAADPAHPLHDVLFDKSDAEEARESRIQKARVLIRRAYITVTHNTGVVRVPVYVKNPETRSGYQPLRAFIPPSVSQDRLAVDELERASSALGRALMILVAIEFNDETLGNLNDAREIIESAIQTLSGDDEGSVAV
jgi:hypothetical protein